MNSRATRILIAMAAASSLVATPVRAEKANQLVDINGMDAGGAESALMSRGFTFISSHNSSGDYTNSYWWNGRDDNCVTVEAYRNRITSINDATDQDCGHHKGSGAAAAVGVVAGAAILGALLSHKSHHREGRDYDQTQTAEFERGYRDGLHHAQYHNYNRDDAYAHGYEKGADEREANLRDHHRRGGYSRIAQFKDLEGARAAGGMSELESRGFRQVDNFTSGNARYSIQYRDESRQCIQVTTADGRLENITDIGTHPSCRSGGSASSNTWFNGLVGAANDGAEVQLRQNGFRQVDSFEPNGGGHSYIWYNSSTRQCLELQTRHGKITSSKAITRHPMCR